MACGLPVITSVSNGGSQIITEGFNGFVLSDAQDSLALSRIISRLYEQPELRRSRRKRRPHWALVFLGTQCP